MEKVETIVSSGASHIMGSAIEDGDASLSEICTKTVISMSTLQESSENLSFYGLIGLEFKDGLRFVDINGDHERKLSKIGSKAEQECMDDEKIEKLLDSSRDVGDQNTLTSYKSRNSELLPLVPDNRNEAIKNLSRFKCAVEMHPELLASNRQLVDDIEELAKWRQCLSVLSEILDHQYNV